MTPLPVASTSSLSSPKSLMYDDFEDQGVYISGAPLTRMIDWECLSVSSLEDESDCCSSDDIFYGNINLNDDGLSLSDYISSARETDSDDEEDCSLRTPIAQLHLQQAIEDIAQHADNISNPRWLLQQNTTHTSPSTAKILIRHLPSTSRSSRELSIWRFLNQPHIRRDPWNPAPPVLSIIEREVGLSASARFARLVEFGPDEDNQKEYEALIAIERLHPLHVNPLETRNDWLDFIRQMLQSLVFLHEHNIARVKFSLSNEIVSPTIMMDIGLAPQHIKFSRSDYPVKYYFVDYSEAIRLEVQEHERETRRGRPRNVVRLSASRSERFHRSPNDDFTPYNHKPHARQILFPSDHISSNLSPYKEIRKHNSPSRAVISVKLLDDLSDPETDSGSEAFSSDDEDDALRRVPSSTRSLAFDLDLKALVEMLEEALPSSVDLAKSLAPLFNTIRQGTTSAAMALDAFEKCVRY